MVGTMGPMVHGAKRRAKGVLTIHGLGCILGGSVLGIILSLTGACVEGWLQAPLFGACLPILGILSLAYCFREFGLLAVPLPQFNRQTPQKWRRIYSPRATSLLYGLDLGFGISTRAFASTFLVVLLWVTTQSNISAGMITMGLGYGLGRVLAVAVALRRPGLDTRALVFESLPRWENVIRLANGILLATVGAQTVYVGFIHASP